MKDKSDKSKKKTKKGSGSKNKSKSGKKRKKHGPKKVKAKRKNKKSARQKASRSKKGRKKPKGPSVGPKPIDPSTVKPKKKFKKKKKKWPPKKKKKKPSGSSNDSDLLQFDDFAPHVGTFFTVTDFNPTIDIELIEVESLGATVTPDDVTDEIRDEPFALLFMGPLDVLIPQDVYTLEHEDMETMTLLLVPAGDWDETTPPGYNVIVESTFA